MTIPRLPRLFSASSVLLVIIALAAAARFIGLDQGLPFDYHYDERIYFHESLFALANGLRREATVSANLPYLLLPVVALQWAWLALTGGGADFATLVRAYVEGPGSFVLLGRAVWAILGVLSVVATYRIGRRVADGPVGLIGAFLLAGAFLPVEQSHFIKNDVPAGLFLLLALGGCLDILERGRRRDYLLAGLWVGLAASTKYYTAIVFLVIILAHVLALRSVQARPTPHASRFTAHTPLLWAVLGAVAALVGTMPVLVLDPGNLLANLAGEVGARFGSIPTDGQAQWLFYLNEHVSNGVGGLILGSGVGGALFMLLRRNPRQILFVMLPLLVYLAIVTRPNNFARYIVPVVPFLCIAAGFALRTGVGQLLSLGKMQLRALAQESDNGLLRALTSTATLRRLTPLVLTLGALVLSAESWDKVARYDRLALAPDTRSAAQGWIETHLPAGASVVVEGGESYTRTSNLGPQIRPSRAYLEQNGPNSPAEAFFWQALLDQAARPPTYNLRIRDVGTVARHAQEVDGQRVQVPVLSVDEWGRPDAFVLISWRSATLGPGSTEPFWLSLTTNYTLAATFACQPCFPDDPYAWRMDYPTLARIDPFAPAGAVVAGPGVRVFLRK